MPISSNKKAIYPAGDYTEYSYATTLYGVTSLHKLSKIERRNSSNALLEWINYSYSVGSYQRGIGVRS